MNRLALLLLIGFLATSTAGILDLVTTEPCSPSESANSPSDGSCPATCLKCHCARAFEFVAQLIAVDPAVSVPDRTPPEVVSLPLVSRDILHVPKLPLG